MFSTFQALMWLVVGPKWSPVAKVMAIFREAPLVTRLRASRSIRVRSSTLGLALCILMSLWLRSKRLAFPFPLHLAFELILPNLTFPLQLGWFGIFFFNPPSLMVNTEETSLAFTVLDYAVFYMTWSSIKYLSKLIIL